MYVCTVNFSLKFYSGLNSTIAACTGIQIICIYNHSNALNYICIIFFLLSYNSVLHILPILLLITSST